MTEVWSVLPTGNDGRPLVQVFRFDECIEFMLAELACMRPDGSPNPGIAGNVTLVDWAPLAPRLVAVGVDGPDEWAASVLAHPTFRVGASLDGLYDAFLAGHNGMTAEEAIDALASLTLADCPLVASRARLNYLSVLDSHTDFVPWWSDEIGWEGTAQHLAEHEDGDCHQLGPCYSAAVQAIAVPALAAILGK